MSDDFETFKWNPGVAVLDPKSPLRINSIGGPFNSIKFVDSEYLQDGQPIVMTGGEAIISRANYTALKAAISDRVEETALGALTCAKSILPEKTDPEKAAMENNDVWGVF